MYLQRKLPYDVSAKRPLPGIAPLDLSDWVRIDEAYAGQMARRVELIREQRETVIALDEAARPAAQELCGLVLDAIQTMPGFERQADQVQCPDGRVVDIDAADPLATIGQLVQEDFCILQKHGDEHVLTGAVLCFPASWSLDEKFGRPLIGIHIPVSSYDENIARRVQRLFDGVKPERPLWRNNQLWYADPELHQPRREMERRTERHSGDEAYFRSEMQTIRRLPDTGAVVFGIHTYVLRREDIQVTE